MLVEKLRIGRDYRTRRRRAETGPPSFWNDASRLVIASAAKQSSFSSSAAKLDCFVADAPRNDER
jgi:hypothetical protein